MSEESRNNSEVEILANALADSSREANSSSKNVVRVLGVLLAFSVLGNIALAGLNISGAFMGTEIKMDSKAKKANMESMEEAGAMDSAVPTWDE